MRIRGLDGREYNWNIIGKPRANCSKNHQRAREVIKKMFPCDLIAEELPLPGSKTVNNKVLFADFYIHARRLMIEVHGEQHHKQVNFFHKTKQGFFKSMYRDNTKRNWCLANDITLIVLEESGSDEEWSKILEEFNG